MLCQRGKQREAHFADAAHERLLLHLNALVLQQVGRLAEDLHTLRALERAVLRHHALVLVWVGQVGNVVATGSAFMPSVGPYLQGGLLRLDNVLLRMLRLLQGGIRLQDDTVHGAAQRVVACLRESVYNRGWSHCMLLLLLLPCLRHPGCREDIPNLTQGWMQLQESL